jgi:ABC-type transport system involved in multi-copper enzyme maturation permease subunit
MRLPLLAKDLTERAARPRTYVVRALFGLVLVGWFAWSMRSFVRAEGGGTAQAGMAMMGAGRDLFATLTKAICVALLIVQPALMAPAFTHEKERGTLALLLLTPQHPWKLVLEKYLAGLLPVATLLLFGLPLGAVAYAYGGVTPAVLAAAGLVLLVTWLQAGAAALLCSAWCRTTPAAILTSYALLGIFYFATSPEIRGSSVRQYLQLFDGRQNYVPGRSYRSMEEYSQAVPREGRRPRSRAVWLPRTTFPMTLLNSALEEERLGLSVDEQAALYLQQYYSDSLSVRGAPGALGRSRTEIPGGLSPLTFDCLCGLAVTALFVFLARRVLIRRAEVPASRFWPRFFQWLDRQFNRINRRFGGIAFATKREARLVDRPILWRESTTGVLGRPQHLVRISLGITLLVTLILLPTLWQARSNGPFINYAGLVLRGLFVVSGLILVIRAVEAIAGERSRQTLEVLLSTPVERGQIIQEKARPLWWLTLAVAAPIALLYLARYAANASLTNEIYIGSQAKDPIVLGSYREAFRAGIAILAMFVAFWEFRWLGLWLGLRVHSRTKATTIVLGVILAWTYLPRLAEYMLARVLTGEAAEIVAWLHVIPPDGLLSFNERGNVSVLAYVSGIKTPEPIDVAWVAAIVLTFHSLIAFTLRWRCLRDAERHLLRA